jgi:hypothetical protein
MGNEKIDLPLGAFHMEHKTIDMNCNLLNNLKMGHNINIGKPRLGKPCQFPNV